MNSCKDCRHRVEKKKKEIVEQLKYNYKDGTSHKVPQSPYANMKCDMKHILKFGITECPDFARVE